MCCDITQCRHGVFHCSAKHVFGPLVGPFYLSSLFPLSRKFFRTEILQNVIVAFTGIVPMHFVPIALHNDGPASIKSVD